VSEAREAAERLAAVQERIARACARAGRAPGEVTLMAVSKRQPIERVALAVAAGVRCLGENYVQAIRERRPQLEALISAEQAAELRWHMIGGLQRNKAKLVVPLVDAVESVDRESLAVELDRRAAEAGRVLAVCLQVNVSREAQKSGVAPEALPALLEATAGLANLRVEGLMTVPAADGDARAAFAQLRALRDTLRSAPGGTALRELSMGMSGDFEIAIEEGATRVRVGTAIFGAREA
jgi:pyridoxal phosphate enzyme (YggS family)